MAYYRKLFTSSLRCTSTWCVYGRGLVTASLARERLSKLSSAMKKNWISLSVAGAICAVPIAQVDVSHEALIKRASSLVTDSANTYLSQTTLALVDSLTQYAKAIRMLVALHRRYEASATRLTPADEEAVWQILVQQREEVSIRKEHCKRFESNWMTAINLSELAAEAAYNAGADQASVAARSSLDLAQSQVEHVRQLSLQAEEDLREAKALESPRVEPSAVPSAADEDEEIPEAYLRED
ncbi:diablo, IAP-binding mitochondrial protein b [Alosa pseudoharengus]|uniref:diablo, IAP-binding mitochondrial protein b n=1 Tax=Alosa pseudoharengus TaxID=34774 RepID=UPI003F8BF73E